MCHKIKPNKLCFSSRNNNLSTKPILFYNQRFFSQIDWNNLFYLKIEIFKHNLEGNIMESRKNIW